MARKCVFCDGGPLTKEHGWPQWLETVLPGRVIRSTSVYGGFSDGSPREDRGLRRSVAGIEVRGVCGSCNHGWMSRLEVAARPFLGPMILGKGTLLDRSAQEIVSTWMVKTCLVHMLTHPKKYWQNFPDVYKAFFHTQRPSDRCHVSIGAFTGEKHTTAFIYQPLVFARDGDPPPIAGSEENAFVCTIAIGHLMGQVLCAPIPLNMIIGDRQRFVWPYLGDFIWPPGQFLNAAELDIAAHTMFQPIESHPNYSASQGNDPNTGQVQTPPPTNPG
jgi:hypothetical protein